MQRRWQSCYRSNTYSERDAYFHSKNVADAQTRPDAEASFYSSATSVTVQADSDW
jgi:hypothetical protein